MAVATSPKVPTGGADIDVDASDSAESSLLNFEFATLKRLQPACRATPRQRGHIPANGCTCRLCAFVLGTVPQPTGLEGAHGRSGNGFGYLLAKHVFQSHVAYFEDRFR
jgi:hypothetical protein